MACPCFHDLQWVDRGTSDGMYVQQRDDEVGISRIDLYILNIGSFGKM